jgi:uncharacterized protein (TIGR00369 family)
MSEHKTTEKGFFWKVLDGELPPPPVAEVLGWKLLQVDPAAGTVRIQFEGKPEFLNPAGTIQGGLLAAMLDDTMGPALAAKLGPEQMAVTLELKTNFIQPGKPGILIGEGKVTSMGKSICFLEGRLTDDKGNLIATASATARVFTRGS